MLRYKTKTKPGLVALYDIQPGNGAGPFLQPRSPHGAWFWGSFITDNSLGLCTVGVRYAAVASRMLECIYLLCNICSTSPWHSKDKTNTVYKNAKHKLNIEIVLSNEDQTASLIANSIAQYGWYNPDFWHVPM